jgi:hypothetical protein
MITNLYFKEEGLTAARSVSFLGFRVFILITIMTIKNTKKDKTTNIYTCIWWRRFQRRREGSRLKTLTWTCRTLPTASLPWGSLQKKPKGFTGVCWSLFVVTYSPHSLVCKIDLSQIKFAHYYVTGTQWTKLFGFLSRGINTIIASTIFALKRIASVYRIYFCAQSSIFCCQFL